MKKIIIIITICLTLVAIITVGLKFLEIGPFANVQEVDKSSLPLKSIFFQMKPITIPIIYGNEVAANLNLKIKIESKIIDVETEYEGSLRERKKTIEKEEKGPIEKIIPLIEDIFIKDLHSFVPRFFKKYDFIDNRVLEKRLSIITSRQFGTKKIHKLTIDSKIEPIPN